MVLYQIVCSLSISDFDICIIALCKLFHVKHSELGELVRTLGECCEWPLQELGCWVLLV